VERVSARRFEDLLVWQKAHRFVLTVYPYSEGFPVKETYGLTSQFRRVAVSVPANIAEGFKKKAKATRRVSSTSPKGHSKNVVTI
jgi:four helix bundle protein